MGNRVTNTLDKWGLNPSKISLKRSKRKPPPVSSPHQSIDPHIYDDVTTEPEYSKVNRKKNTNSDGLHYAEIQVLQSEIASKPKAAPPKTSGTEYATIDFLRGAKSEESKPADILIPPGELQRMMVKSTKRRSASSHRSVMV